jgi:hypothetical protein
VVHGEQLELFNLTQRVIAQVQDHEVGQALQRVNVGGLLHQEVVAQVHVLQALDGTEEVTVLDVVLLQAQAAQRPERRHLHGGRELDHRDLVVGEVQEPEVGERAQGVDAVDLIALQEQLLQLRIVG